MSQNPSHGWHVRWRQNECDGACAMMNLQWLVNIELRYRCHACMESACDDGPENDEPIVHSTVTEVLSVRRIYVVSRTAHTGYHYNTETGIVGADLVEVGSFPRICISRLQKLLFSSLRSSAGGAR